MPDRSYWQVVAAALDLADPMQGGATTPDVLSVIDFLAMPEAQACAELGIKPAEYALVARGCEKVAALWVNRKAQGFPVGGVPLIKRKKTKRLSPLHRGGKLIRIGSPSR